MVLKKTPKIGKTVTIQVDLLVEYEFDYSKAKPNRFASKEVKEKKRCRSGVVG